MKIDRHAFLSLVSLLSVAACATPAEEPADGTTEAVGEGACVEPQRDDGVYSAAEGCYSLGETWGQCNAWTNHFYAGVARKAIDEASKGTEAYDAGYLALASTCKGAAAEEQRLAVFCAAIADKQLSASDKSMNVRGPGGAYTGSSSRSVLVDACKDIVRGVRIESRPLLASCIDKEPSYPVYACIEGLGFDDAKARCEDQSAVSGLARAADCSPVIAKQCGNADYLKAKPAAEMKSCIQEVEIIRVESGLVAGAEELGQAAIRCAMGSLARSCEAPGARAECGAMVSALQGADPALGTKGHINAGGAFTKRCIKVLSGMSPLGVQGVSICVKTDADAVKAGRKTIGDVSLDGCVAALLAAEG